jgi:hypothetical protein
MAIHDEHFVHLLDDLAAAGRRRIEVELANSLKSANTLEGPTVYELGEAEAAEIAWKAADEALTDYQSSRLQPFRFQN